MNSDDVSDRTLNEYYKLFGFVQKYDEYFLRIKSWSVTAGSAGLALGFKDQDIYIFFACGLLSLCFWVTEVYFRLIQESHVKTLDDIECSIEEGSIPDRFVPRILSSYRTNLRVNFAVYRWLEFGSRMSAALPHALILLLSITGVILA